jgi:hypothetical protein
MVIAPARAGAAPCIRGIERLVHGTVTEKNGTSRRDRRTSRQDRRTSRRDRRTSRLKSAERQRVHGINRHVGGNFRDVLVINECVCGIISLGCGTNRSRHEASSHGFITTCHETVTIRIDDETKYPASRIVHPTASSTRPAAATICHAGRLEQSRCQDPPLRHCVELSRFRIEMSRDSRDVPPIESRSHAPAYGTRRRTRPWPLGPDLRS